MKKCCKCRELLPETDFWIDRSTKDGLYRKCKRCGSVAKKKKCNKCKSTKRIASEFYHEIPTCKDCLLAVDKKQCARCRKLKSLAEFYKGDGKGSKQSVCKACRRTPEYQKKASHRVRLRTYGLTDDQYIALLKKYDEKCGICETTATTSRTGRHLSLHIDHDHETGEVRGLLCGDCNLGLGRFKDDTRRLKNAINYLKRHAGSKNG